MNSILKKIKGLQNNQKQTIQTQTLKPNSGGLEQLVTNLSSWLRWTSVKFSTTYNNSGKDIWDYCKIYQQSLPLLSNIAKRISVLRTKQPDVYASWTQRVKYHTVIRSDKNWKALLPKFSTVSPWKHFWEEKCICVCT